MENKGVYIPPELLADDQIGAGHKIVYAIMLANADEDGICRMSARKIGDLRGATEHAVQSCRLKLCHFGYAERLPDSDREYRLLKYLERRRDGHHGNG